MTTLEQISKKCQYKTTLKQEEIIKLIKNGDTKKITENSYAFIISTIKKCNCQINDDTIQEAYTAILQAIESYDKSESNFSTYAFVSIRNQLRLCAYNRFLIKVPVCYFSKSKAAYKEKFRHNLENAMQVTTLPQESMIPNTDNDSYNSDTVIEKVDNSLIKEKMNEILNCLPEQYKKLYILRFVEEKKLHQIAKIIGVNSIQLVKKRIETLQRLVKEQFEKRYKYAFVY
jgi:RNA polymerase sigma factor (sigma-70 family)